MVVRYEGFSEKEREVWPYRNLLLVTMPGGAKYVIESAFGFVDEKHLEEDRPFHRVASARTAFEMWASGGFEDPETAAEDPCGGSRQKVRAPGGSLDFMLTDLSSRTVRTSLAEISAATFDANERNDLVTLLKVVRRMALPLSRGHVWSERAQRALLRRPSHSEATSRRLLSAPSSSCRTRRPPAISPRGAASRTCRWTSRRSRRLLPEKPIQ